MDSRKIVFHETAIVAIGEVICSALTIGVFAALGHFKMNVLWGSITGCGIIVLNYFFMAVFASLAADRAEKGDTQQAKKMIQLSSVVRLVLMGLALFVGIRLGANILALALPLLLLRPILLVAEFFRKKGD